MGVRIDPIASGLRPVQRVAMNQAGRARTRWRRLCRRGCRPPSSRIAAGSEASETGLPARPGLARTSASRAIDQYPGRRGPPNAAGGSSRPSGSRTASQTARSRFPSRHNRRAATTGRTITAATGNNAGTFDTAAKGNGELVRSGRNGAAASSTTDAHDERLCPGLRLHPAPQLTPPGSW